MTEKEFLEKIENHKRIIYKVSRMYFEDSTDREDLFQEIILQTWKSIGSFKGNSQFSTWLYRIAINTAIVFFKKEKKRNDLIIKSQKKEAVFEEDITDKKEKQLYYFYKSVYQLNIIEKALILQYIDGCSGEEMSLTLGLSPANVRVKLNRAKKKLKEMIKKQGYEF